MNTKEIYLLVNKTWALQMYSKNIGFCSKGTIRLERRGIICWFITILVLWKFWKKHVTSQHYCHIANIFDSLHFMIHNIFIL